MWEKIWEFCSFFTFLKHSSSFHQQPPTLLLTSSSSDPPLHIIILTSSSSSHQHQPLEILTLIFPLSSFLAFTSLSGQKLHEFRRGVKRCVSIYSLAFSGDAQYLAASSNTETVHVFRLESSGRPQDGRRPSGSSTQPAAAADGADGGWMGYLGTKHVFLSFC